jgi:hypothetical protein
MYRGSSFLLQNSFCIHKRPIRELLKPKYERLWHADIGVLSQAKTIDTILQLAAALRALYPNQVTDTLITKILLGTIGCTPAFDRLFKSGCSKRKIRPHSNLTRKSLFALAQFYQTNSGVFASVRKRIKRASGITYPPMKLVDMLFWSVGGSRRYN